MKRDKVFIKLLAIFIFVPLMEIYLLIEAGRLIGVAPTISLILLTGIAGAWLARSQGIDIVRRIQQETAAGHMPAANLVDGALVLIGGLLLLTPGFFTDLLGFSFLVPQTRALWRKAIRVWLEKQIGQGTVTIHHL